MFGFGAKSKEKKAKKELEKLEKKEAKVKDKLAKLEEKAKKKEEKKNKKNNSKEIKDVQEPQEKKPTIYSFLVTGTKPFYGRIKYDLTTYNEYYEYPLDEGEIVYKYTTNVSKLELHDKEDSIHVVANGLMIGYVPDDKLEEVRTILAEHPDCDKYCLITGGEFKEKDEGHITRDEIPYYVEVYLRYR